MNAVLQHIADGVTDFTPEGQGLDLEAFQSVVLELRQLRTEGLIGPVHETKSKRLEPHFGKVIYVRVEGGLTDQGRQRLAR
jgi:hypothetical protein